MIARHPSRAYYLGKFLQRHRTAASLGAIAFVSLVAGIAVAVKQTAAARRERDRATAALTQARQALHESEETTSFLAGLFDVDVPAPGSASPGTTQRADRARHRTGRAARGPSHRAGPDARGNGPHLPERGTDSRTRSWRTNDRSRCAAPTAPVKARRRRRRCSTGQHPARASGAMLLPIRRRGKRFAFTRN